MCLCWILGAPKNTDRKCTILLHVKDQTKHLLQMNESIHCTARSRTFYHRGRTLLGDSGWSFFHRSHTTRNTRTARRLGVCTWQSLGLNVNWQRKEACHNLLSIFWHPLAFRILLVALNPYGARGQISKLLVVHLAEDLCINRMKRTGSAWFPTAVS